MILCIGKEETAMNGWFMKNNFWLKLTKRSPTFRLAQDLCQYTSAVVWEIMHKKDDLNGDTLDLIISPHKFILTINPFSCVNCSPGKIPSQVKAIFIFIEPQIDIYPWNSCQTHWHTPQIW